MTISARFRGGPLRLLKVVVGVMVFGLFPGLHSLQGQVAEWPPPGAVVRITSLPGPPPGLETVVSALVLAEGPWRQLSRRDGGAIRFMGRLVDGDAERISIQRSASGQVVDFRLADLAAVEERIGSRSQWRGGMMIGAAVGAVVGAVILGGGLDEPLGGAVYGAVPLGALGALLGTILRATMWSGVYPSG